ncbi:hypothetical protein [Caenibacillus caldisaponilyticus]|uniref:hypothetical protein n=1 Tax=Caenibacillus caldisaponilyticus TaxID=1674942 RepID=UPI0009888D41|nr:hypothetical protein [Caenibacillus caldisaponilyticus]
MMGFKMVANLLSPGRHLCGLAWDGETLWHSDGTTNRLYRIDPGDGTVLGSIPCERVRTCLSIDEEGRLWQIAGNPKRIRVLDPLDGRMVREIPFDDDAESVCALYVGSSSYWLGSKTTGRVEERDINTRAVLQAYQTDGSVHGIALVDRVIWYTDFPASALVAFDLERRTEVARYPLPGQPTGLCWDGGRLWYCDYTNKRITAVEVDLASRHVR